MHKALGWLLGACLVLFLFRDMASAERISDVRNTKHNLSTTSSTATRTVLSKSTPDSGQVVTSEICVFCHTPHGAQVVSGSALTPLWNRSINTTANAYTRYTSSSLDADSVTAGFSAQPGGSSKLCLSCHDGTLAIGNVGVYVGAARTISMQGVNAQGKLTDTGTGYNKNLGEDLTNDHPISVKFTSDLATADGELRSPSGTKQTVAGLNLPTGKTHAVGIREKGAGPTKPLLPLEGADSSAEVQCASCHDPHLKEADSAALDFEREKFLRAKRFQSTTPAGGTFDYSKDIVCLACHDKGDTNPGSVWANSVHANSTDANEQYRSTTRGSETASTTPTALRDFPSTLQVWQAACLNCHDPHTVPGTRRLLREGNDSSNSPKTAGNPALEETCYQCHRPRADQANILNMTTQTVPDIYSDFQLTTHMPITGGQQCAGSEKHSIGDTDNANPGKAVAKMGKDFVERPELLGKGVAGTCNSNNTRHVECTDCHNPHRMQKGNHAASNGGTDIRGTANGNLISNVLKGTFGVEPDYSGAADTKFGRLPAFPATSLRCGIAGATNKACNSEVTKEYQICLKCHSNYAYDDVDDPVDTSGCATAPSSTCQWNYSGRPSVGQPGTTATNQARFNAATTTTTDGNKTNLWPDGTYKYTNQAMEFWGPDSHKGEQTNTGGSEPNHTLTGVYALPNHRSWHPVMQPTGRTKSERGSTSVDNFKAPFSANVGTQTMYCADCHGSNAASLSNNNPDNNADGLTKPWGPHGSSYPFILKGTYDVNTNYSTTTGDLLCLKCHFAFSGASRSGFCCDKDNNLHNYHQSRMNNIKCNNCHIAVPHGWKHKALLADTRTVGNEVGLASDTNIGGGNWAKDSTFAGRGYTRGPYYLNAMLKVATWRRSGQWVSGDCNGGVGGMKASCQNQ
jgi:hypothetical protein